MKRGLILFLAAVLALVGCKKEVATGVQGGDQTVTFSVVADNAATKAGEATAIPSTIDTCVAVVRMYDAHNVLIGDVYASPKCTKFGESYKFSVDLMGGQKYEVTVLLYTKGVYTVDSKLEAIKRAAAELPYNLHAEHDLFSASITYQAGDNTPLIIAKRPFAQLNLITTDLVQNFEPAVTVKYTAPDTFNAVTGEASGARVYETLGVVTSYDYAPNQCTISSDYIFASDEKSLISVEMKAEKVGTFVRTFDNLPLQRNYKTNVIGKLLTVDAPFTVQVNANWNTPANDIHWQNAENIAAANAILADAPAGKDLNIKVNVPDDAATVPVIFTPQNEDTNVALTFEQNTSATPMTITFTKNADETVMPASVTIEAPAGTNLVFEKETHVVINGHDYGTISGSFTASTLVINEGVHVGKIIINGGGLEIHGTVDALEVSETDHANNPVLVRDCENLNDAVYAVAKQFVAKGYAADDATNSIVKNDFYQDENGVWHVMSAKAFKEFAAAVNAGTTFEGKTVVLDSDIDFQNATVAPVGNHSDNKPFRGTFNGNNKKLSNLTVQNIVGKQGVGVFGKVYEPCVIKDLTVENATVIGDKTVAGDKAIAYVGGIAGHGYAKIQNCTFKGNIYAGHQMGGIAGSGGFTITGCTFEGNIISERDWGLGGIIGNCQDGGAISGNTAKGTISAKNADYCGLIAGGIIGCAIYTTYDVKNNYAAMSMSYDGAAVENVYPIVGVYNIDAPGTGNEDFAALLTHLADNTWDKTISAKDSYDIMYNHDSYTETGYVLNYGAATTKDSVAKIGETGYDSLPAAFAAVKAGETIEILKAGTYTLPSPISNITIKGAVAGVVFNAVKDYGQSVSKLNGVKFESVKFIFGSSNYTGFQHSESVEFTKCTFEGRFNSYGAMLFDQCIFNSPESDYSMWCYAGDVTYKDCTINCNGKFANLYNEGNALKDEENNPIPWKVVVEGCTFNSTKKSKAALNIKATCGSKPLYYDVQISNCVANGENWPAASQSETLVVGSALWQVDDIKSTVNSDIKVTVDGAVVYGGNE